MARNKYKEHGYSLTDEDKIKLNIMYWDAKTLDEMYRVTHIPTRLIQRHFKDLSMDMVKRYKINSNYFEIIDIPEKAYWLGYMYCDGFVGGGKYNNIVLSSIDEEVVESFVNEVCEKGKHIIKKSQLASEKKRYNQYAVNTLYEARFSDREMKDDLYKYGIYANRKNKDFLNYRLVDQSLWEYIFFGFIDADGYVGVTPTRYSGISIYISPYLKREYLEFFSHFGLSHRLSYNKHRNGYYYCLHGTPEISKKFLKRYSEFSPMTRKTKNIASWLANSQLR